MPQLPDPSVPRQQRGRKSRIYKARFQPFHLCLINSGWQERGLATILISRTQPDDLLVYGVYLVDIWCLGLKNTFCNSDLTERDFQNLLLSLGRGLDLEECSPALAHTIIYGGIDYAKRLGFTPQKDFRLSRHVLAKRRNVDFCEEVEFGKDGKPRYIAGPHDNVERVISQLEKSAGEGNYDFFYATDVPPTT